MATLFGDQGPVGAGIWRRSYQAGGAPAADSFWLSCIGHCASSKRVIPQSSAANVGDCLSILAHATCSSLLDHTYVPGFLKTKKPAWRHCSSKPSMITSLWVHPAVWHARLLHGNFASSRGLLQPPVWERCANRIDARDRCPESPGTQRFTDKLDDDSTFSPELLTVDC